MILLLLWGLGLSAAQDDGGAVYGDGGEKKWWDPDGVSNCQRNSPIAGTAGYRNAQSAITTNAQTYGAAQYAEKNLFPMVHRQDRPEQWQGAGSMETNLVFTATRFPAVEAGYPFGDCPYDYRVSMRALDLGASNFGFAAKKGRVGLFYAGSLTWSQPAYANNAARGMLTGSNVMWGPIGAALAPAMGRWDYEVGVATISPDWIAGATVDAEIVFAEAGYVGSQGFYGHVQEGRIGFFGSALLKLGLKQLPFYKAGTDRVETPVGLTSLYARRLPFEALPRYSPSNGARLDDNDDELEEKLETVHLEQMNLGGRLDVQAAAAWSPNPALYEAQLALHNKGYHQARKADAESQEKEGLRGQVSPGWMIKGGVVNMPDLFYYGIEGGIRPTFHLEGTTALTEESPVFIQMRLHMNDPELLALYPYAKNAVGFSYRLWAAY